MGQKPVISVRNLSKQYRIGLGKKRHDTLRDAIADFIRSRFRRLTVRSGEAEAEDIIWALRDVSFDVKQGDVVGVIGRNGAGKSTLLKILTRITHPTSGSFGIRGRVASLLEVGTGFHPELTGRENIFLNGAILGMTRAEIRSKFDEIVEFAEIAKFIDTPVKRYSSGMYVRLAFSVAAHLDPEILLVDEVLAVGDVEFQKRCLGKMESQTKEGRTVLFVSHNMASVNNLCPETILLEKGRMKMRGPSADVIAEYLRERTVKQGEFVWNEEEREKHDVLQPVALRIRDSGDEVTARVLAREPFTFEFEYDITREVSNLRVGVTLQNSEGQFVMLSFDQDNPEHCFYKRNPGRYKALCTMPANLLNEGTFVLGLITGIPASQNTYRDMHLIEFEVDITEGVGYTSPRLGVVRPKLEWFTEFKG